MDLYRWCAHAVGGISLSWVSGCQTVTESHFGTCMRYTIQAGKLQLWRSKSEQACNVRWAADLVDIFFVNLGSTCVGDFDSSLVRKGNCRSKES